MPRSARSRVRRRPGLGALLLWPLLGVAAAHGPLAAQAVTRYVAFGDSITEGVGDSVPEGPAAGYPVRLENLLGSDIVDVTNRGRSGERTPEGLTRIDEVLLDGGDALLLMEGTNDISRRISLESTLFNLAEMARKAENQDFRVVHATLIPRLPNARVDRENWENQELNQSIRDLAGRRERDLADHFEVYGAGADLFARWYWVEAEDPVGHPNPAGYDVMARTFADVLRDLDSVPPVLGRARPAHAEQDVPAATTIAVDVWDFGRGVDAASLQLTVNGGPVTAAATSAERRVTLTYAPPQPLRGLVTVGLRGRDLAQPANTFERTVARFFVAGTAPLQGVIVLDGRVDGRDLLRVAVAFGANRSARRFDERSDLNQDGLVDGTDLALLAANFGRSS